MIIHFKEPIIINEKEFYEVNVMDFGTGQIFINFKILDKMIVVPNDNIKNVEILDIELKTLDMQDGKNWNM